MDFLRPKIYWEKALVEARFSGEVNLEPQQLYLINHELSEGIAPPTEARAAKRVKRLPQSPGEDRRHDPPGIDEAQGVLVPSTTSISVRATEQATQVTTTMIFSNSSIDTIENAFFSFPLPNGSSVTSFVCALGEDRVIRSEAKPLDKAIAEFEGAVSNRKAAVLLKEVTPELFTAALGYIPGKAQVKATVSLVMVLKHKIADVYHVATLTIPTYIAPRYGHKPLGLSEPIPGQNSCSVHIEVEIASANKLHEVASKTHAISTSFAREAHPCDTWEEFSSARTDQDLLYLARVKLEQPTIALDGDFVLDITTSPQCGPTEPQAWIETHPKLEDHHAILLNLPPGIFLKPKNSVPDAEIVFLADRSGSMEDKMDALRSAMMFFLKGIPRDRRFNIWSFGDVISSLWDRSRPKDKVSLQEAVSHVEGEFHANMGGTELLSALKAIVQARPATSHFTTDVIILTDGEVWNQEETIDFVKSARKHSDHRVRFFALGIGSAVSHALVEGIAQSGGGYAEVVPASQKSDWEDRVVVLLKAALQSHIGTLHLQMGEEAPEGFKHWKSPSILVSPADSTNLSPFVTNQVFVIFESCGLQMERLRILVQSDQILEDTTRRVLTPKKLKGSDTLLNSLAARALLKDLDSNQSRLHQIGYPTEDMVRHEGERIACKWSLASKWTAFIGVEQRKGQNVTRSISIIDSVDRLSQKKDSPLGRDLGRPMVGRRRTTMAKPHMTCGRFMSGHSMHMSREPPKPPLVHELIDPAHSDSIQLDSPSFLSAHNVTSNKTYPPNGADTDSSIGDDHHEHVNAESDPKAAIRHLVSLQVFHGSFNFKVSPEDEIADLFGEESRNILRQIAKSTTEALKPISEAKAMQIAVCTFLIVVLQQRLADFENYWLLLVETSRQFVVESLEALTSTLSADDMVRIAKEVSKQQAAEVRSIDSSSIRTSNGIRWLLN